MPDTLNLPDEPASETTREPVPLPAASDSPTSFVAAPEPANSAAVEDAAASPAPAEIAAAAAPAIPELAPADCAARLAELFPAVFSPGAAKPLKLRIQADIQQRSPGIFTKKTLSIFLHRHTTSTAYLRALVASPQRTDLDGVPAGDVADEHRAAATTELDRRRALHDERRAAEREAQRKMHDARRKSEAAPRSPQGMHPPPAETQRSNPDAQPGHPDAPQRPPEAPRRPAQATRRPLQDGSRRPPDARPPAHGAQRAPQRRPHDPQSTAQAEPAYPPDEGAPATADDGARRERAALLRAYESSTLTRANFCVLKRMTEVQLEEQLAQARLDAPRREPAPQRPAAPGIRPPPGDPLQRRGSRR